MKIIPPTHRATWAIVATAGVIGLSACTTPRTPLTLPDGSNRVPVNSRTVNPPQDSQQDQAQATPPAPATNSASESKAHRSNTVLDSIGPKGKTVRVSLITTLEKIARNTGLRLRDNDLADEVLSITPNEDPFNVLRQLAGKTRYRISVDRNVGRLILSNASRAAGVVMLREIDLSPVEQIGSPVALPSMPSTPVPISEALRLLAPDDFEVGYLGEIDPNIRVDLVNVGNWMDGLERVALQTPYRVVFDWGKKIVYAKPVKEIQK